MNNKFNCINLLYSFFKPLYDKICCIYFLCRYRIRSNEELVVIDSEDEEYYFYALVHLKEYISKRFLDKVCVITDYSGKLSVVDSENIKKIVFVDTNKLNRIIDSSHLSDRIRAVSLNKPELRKNHGLLNIPGITKEDIVCYCDYELFNYKIGAMYEKNR